MGRNTNFPKNALNKVALLASTGKSQKEIQIELGISAASVNRLYKEAVRSEIIVVRDPLLRLSKRKEAEVRLDLFGESPLREQLVRLSKGTLDELVVIKTTSSTYKDRIHEFTYGASADILENVFPRARNVAVAWGSTMRALVQHVCKRLQSSKHIDAKSQALNFIQVCGDPPDAIEKPAMRSSSLVAALERAFNSNEVAKYTFSTTAAIPKILSRKSTAKPIREFIYQCGAYSSIFFRDLDGRQRLRENLNIDALITSCGGSNHSLDPWLYNSNLDSYGSGDKLADLTIGNICGNWLPKSDPPTAQEIKELDKINNRWNGIVLEDIKAIRERNGVVLVAAGDQDQIIMRLLKKQLVSRLIISSSLATDLKNKLGISTD